MDHPGTHCGRNRDDHHHDLAHIPGHDLRGNHRDELALPAAADVARTDCLWPEHRARSFAVVVAGTRDHAICFAGHDVRTDRTIFRAELDPALRVASSAYDYDHDRAFPEIWPRPERELSQLDVAVDVPLGDVDRVCPTLRPDRDFDSPNRYYPAPAAVLHDHAPSQRPPTDPAHAASPGSEPTLPLSHAPWPVTTPSPSLPLYHDPSTIRAVHVDRPAEDPAIAPFFLQPQLELPGNAPPAPAISSSTFHVLAKTHAATTSIVVTSTGCATSASDSSSTAPSP